MGNNKDLLLPNIWYFSGFLFSIKTASHINMDIIPVPFFNSEMSIILPEIKGYVQRYVLAGTIFIIARPLY